MSILSRKGGLSAEKRRLMEKILNRQMPSKYLTKQSIQRRDPSEPAQLSFAQQRLWFLDQLVPGNPAYTFCNIARFDGKLDIACLKKSYQEIVNRHEILRTTFVLSDGEPTQHIAEYLELDFPELFIDHFPEKDREVELQKLASDEAKKSIDIAAGPLLRTILVHIAENEHAILQTMHHIIYDGWSLAVLFAELKCLYEVFSENKSSPLLKLCIQYADFALWQRRELETESMKNQLLFWKNQLSGQLPTLLLPTDKRRPKTPTYGGAMQWFHLSKTLTAELELLAKREECTLFMVLLVAYSILLCRYSGNKEILIGTPIANRNRHELEGLIGFFVNTLVLRISHEGNPNFCKLLAEVKEMAAQTYVNQDYPFEKLVEDLQPERHVNQNPIFQTMFALQNTPPPPASIGNVNLSLEEVDGGTAVFDLTLSMYENESGLRGYFEYSTELFEKFTITNMIENFRHLLESIVDGPETEILALKILTDADRHKILKVWNTEKVAYPQDKSIINLIEETAEEKPDAIAIETLARKYTYLELNQFANSIAHTLISHGVMPGEFVGIYLKRSFEMVASILGVLKAGAAYLPLDPDYPDNRLQYMLSDTGANVIVTSYELKDSLPSNKLKRIVLKKYSDIPARLKSSPKLAINPTSLAYIIYTSGSTGEPKGVLVTNQNLMNSTVVRQAYYVDPVKAFLLMSSFSFDSSVAGIFWTLCDGGTLVLPEYGQERDMFEIAKLIQEKEVSHMLSLPVVYSLLLANASVDQLKSLETVCVAGEICAMDLVTHHFEKLPATQLFNEYGPTEATVWSTVYKCTPGCIGSNVPIGRSIPNARVYILDEELKPVPVGITGEVYIGGEGVTNGYLNRSELTAEKFLPDCFASNENALMYKSGDLGKYRADGNIDFLGRVDNQVKVSGYRIELEEIEAALCKNETVSKSVVIVCKSEAGDVRLVAYIESTDNDLAELKKSIAQILPDYMIPSNIIPLKALPLMPNGKVDRHALPDPIMNSIRSQNSYVEPKTPVESVLAKIWAELLEMERVGTHDNFFDLGGHSILAIKVISQIFESFNIHVAIRHLFDSPTIHELAMIMLLEYENKDKIEETAKLIMHIDRLSEAELDELMQNNI